MNVKVICKTCDRELAAADLDAPSLQAWLESTLIQAHAAHTSCTIAFELDTPSTARPLTIECLQCPGARREYNDVPPYLVGAHTITFHTAHESHRFRVSYCGREWESPAKEKRR